LFPYLSLYLLPLKIAAGAGNAESAGMRPQGSAEALRRLRPPLQ
jgi:hypothetical protein